MTYDEQKQYYADLFIAQFRGKPKAQATVQAIATETMCNNIAITIQDAFDLTTAIGAQLDILGKYANVTRNILTFSGGASLSDTDFRSLILMSLAVKGCQGSLNDIDIILNNFFGNNLTVFDNQNMSMSYFFNSRIGSVPLLEAFVELDLLPRPMGVRLSSLIYAVGLDNVFGFGSYYAPPFEISGMSSYYGTTVSTTGNSTNASPTVTNITDTSILTVGWPIGGTAINPLGSTPSTPALFNTILSIDGPTQITLTYNANLTFIAGGLESQIPAPWLSYADVISL